MLETPISTFFYSGFRGTFRKGYVASQRITIPPFPYHEDDLLKAMATGVDVANAIERTPWFWMEDVRKGDDGVLECAGGDGILGAVTNGGKTIEEAANGVYAKVKRIKVGAKLQLRTDGGRRAQRAIPRLQEWGHEVR